MKLIYTDGCVCTSLEVDKKEFNLDLSFPERLEVARKILESCKKSIILEKVYQFYHEDEEDKLKEFSNLDFSKQKQEALKILNSEDTFDREYLTQYIFIKFLESEGKYEYLGHCDCCGDSIIRYSITL